MKFKTANLFAPLYYFKSIVTTGGFVLELKYPALIQPVDHQVILVIPQFPWCESDLGQILVVEKLQYTIVVTESNHAQEIVPSYSQAYTHKFDQVVTLIQSSDPYITSYELTSRKRLFKYFSSLDGMPRLPAPYQYLQFIA